MKFSLDRTSDINISILLSGQCDFHAILALLRPWTSILISEVGFKVDSLFISSLLCGLVKVDEGLTHSTARRFISYMLSLN